MVSPNGTLKITDFGIARRLAAASQTQTGMVMGTAHYISPEQAQGKELSPKADLYSLGVVAYECLTGAPPFDGSTPVEVALQHVRVPPAELPRRVPMAARELVMEMLAKDPLNRPADAGTVAARALGIRASLSTSRRPAARPQVPPRRSQVPAPASGAGRADSRHAGAPGGPPHQAGSLRAGCAQEGSRTWEACCYRQRPHRYPIGSFVGI